MPSGMDIELRKGPLTSEERDLVMQELEAILASSPFRNSRRYPALLKYMVEKTLDGDAAGLKERILGSEVFDRRPDYDTNADPVVRVSAGEIRKRIAQYYQQNGNNSRVQISVPLGSYVPDFKFSSEVPNPVSEQPFGSHLIEGQNAELSFQPAPVNATEAPASAHLEAPERPSTRGFRIRWRALATATAVLITLSCAGWLTYRAWLRDQNQKDLWRKLLESPGSVLIVVGNGHPKLTTPEPAQTPLVDHMLGPYDHISLFSAIALSAVTGALQTRNRSYEIKDDTSTSLRDLRSRPVVLLGAMNDRWTLQLLRPLRYHFVATPIPHIEDTQNPGKLDWALDNTKPYTSVATDYGIIACYHDDSVNGTVIVAAGLGPWANEAASEFISSPRHLKEIADQLPRGWEKENVELILKTQVVGQEPGATSIVKVSTWR